MTLAAPAMRVVLYEGEGARLLSPERRKSLMRTLLDKGYAVVRAAANSAPSPVQSGDLVVLGEFAEGTPTLKDNANKTALHCFDIAGMADSEVLERVVGLHSGEGSAPPAPGKWKPWFPVIDYSRCTNCMQCLSFCLFDVYGVENKRIQVQNNSNCKTDCPACSRVCPEVAILFPKYKSGPINGDEIDAEDLRREAMKVDISSLLGGDIYSLLRDRSAKAKSRFSRERDDERALKERQRCLVKLTQNLEIPPEVLASLPSPDQIREKAAQAQARGEAALKDLAVEGADAAGSSEVAN